MVTTFLTRHKCHNHIIVFMMQLSGASPSAFQVPYNSFKEKLVSSELDKSDVHASNGGLQEGKSKDLDYDFICFFLSADRLNLYKSIDFRCEDMLLGQILDHLISVAFTHLCSYGHKFSENNIFLYVVFLLLWQMMEFCPRQSGFLTWGSCLIQMLLLELLVIDKYTFISFLVY